MGIFDNLVSLKVGETFEIENGIKAIRRRIKDNGSCEIFNLPPFIIKQFEDLFPGKKITLHNVGEKKKYSNSLNVKSVKSQLKSYHIDQEAKFSIINFGARVSFNIVHDDKKIYDISEICIVKCLRCLGRANIHSYYNREPGTLFFGGIYKTSDGLTMIREQINKAERVTIRNLPDWLLKELLCVLSEKKPKKIKILASSKTSLRKELKKFPNARLLPSYISAKVVHYGKETQAGGVAVEGTHFGFAWYGKEIFDIRTTEWEKCTDCMFNIYNAEWIVSKKIRF